MVVEDDIPDAYAVPGIRGRVVVTTAMFAALTTAERDVLLAHEAAHLAHRHHLWIQLSELAAVANPLLRQLPPVVRYAVERWADEDAARAVGDRRLTARAIAHAALAASAAGRRRQARLLDDSVMLAATGGDVPRRVRALLNPPIAALVPPRRGHAHSDGTGGPHLQLGRWIHHRAPLRARAGQPPPAPGQHEPRRSRCSYRASSGRRRATSMTPRGGFPRGACGYARSVGPQARR